MARLYDVDSALNNSSSRACPGAGSVSEARERLQRKRSLIDRLYACLTVSRALVMALAKPG